MIDEHKIYNENSQYISQTENGHLSGYQGIDTANDTSTRNLMFCQFSEKFDRTSMKCDRIGLNELIEKLRAEINNEKVEIDHWKTLNDWIHFKIEYSLKYVKNSQSYIYN